MKRFLCTTLALVAALGAACGTAGAQTRPASRFPHVTIGPFDLGDERLFAVELGVGLASTASYYVIRDKARWISHGYSAAVPYALSSIGCAAGTTLIGAAVVYATEGRPLTSREALKLGANCILPVVGGVLVDASFDANPQWEAGVVAAPVAAAGPVVVGARSVRPARARNRRAR